MSTDGSEKATLTVRVIKSFPYRTCKNLVIHDLDLNATTVGDFKMRVSHDVHTQPGWRAYQTVQFDTLKLYTHAKGTKTQNLIVNLDHDPEWIFEDDTKKLAEVECEHETEISYFNREAYEEYKANPVDLWE